jgi:hypothetical protein
MASQSISYKIRELKIREITEEKRQKKLWEEINLISGIFMRLSWNKERSTCILERRVTEFI